MKASQRATGDLDLDLDLDAELFTGACFRSVMRYKFRRLTYKSVSGSRSIKDPD